MTATAQLAPVEADAIVTHKARMPHPAFLLEGGLDALTGLNRVARSAGLAEPLLHLL